MSDIIGDMEAEKKEGLAQPEPEVIEIEPEPEVIEPPKKRRGRPPRNAEAQEKLDEEKATGEKPKGKPGPKKRTMGADASELLARQLMGLHHMAAMFTGLPVIILSDAEAKMMADALCNVANEYDLAISGKTAATLQLVATLGMVYVPRLIEINNLKTKRPIVENERTIN